MVEAWLIEILKGIGRFFLNPLVYWAILLLLFASYKRIKKERLDFGVKVFDIFSELKNTWRISLVSGFIVSAIMIGTGMIFSYEMILLLAGVTIVLSITMRFSLLSPSYTIGFTFLILLFLPLLMENQSVITDPDMFSGTNFSVVALLLGIMILVESVLINKVKRNDTFPSIALSDRGAWVGQHRIKKLSVVPFFTLVPNGLIEPFAPWWPYFSIGEVSYSIVLIPFLIGFDYLAKGHFPIQAIRKISKFNALLGIGILLIAAGSLFIPFLSIVAVILAIIGKEFLNYKYRVGDRLRRPFFGQLEDGLTIVGIIPATPAARLEIFIGETIVKVNGQKVSTEVDFYEALQSTGAFFKLEVLDDQGENRFVQGAFYEGDHHELGLLFATAPYRQKNSRKSS